jgi:ankyrin repeat protein
LIEAGADPNAITEAGDSHCLMLAAQSGSAAVVRALVTGGAIVDGTADGMTALMAAAGAGDVGITELLLELGANVRVPRGRFAASDYARHGGNEALAVRLDQVTSQASRLTGRLSGPA